MACKKDLKEAFSWYQKAAENGNSYGQNNLAGLYWSGQGVEKDTEKALLAGKGGGAGLYGGSVPFGGFLCLE